MHSIPDVSSLTDKLVSDIMASFSVDMIQSLAFIGIHSNGVPLAKRLSKYISDRMHIVCPAGAINITLFRDDLNKLKHTVTLNHTDIPFDIKNRHIIIVDDVIHTGRTIRAALCCLNEFGRAKSIQCAALLDRGNREMPIDCRYVGHNVPDDIQGQIKLQLLEVHGEDQIKII